MQMDLSSLFALGLFIAIEGLVLFYLKKDIEILKSNKKTFANSSPERQLPLDFYSGAVGPHRIADKPMKN